MGLFSSDPPSHFPIVEGKRLDGGDAVRFPHDLPADATLLILSFMDDRDPLSDQWARLGERIQEQHPERVAVIEVPVVNSKLKLLGGLATMGIRGQVDHDDEKARTIPIYVDVKPFKKSLQVKTQGVYPFLLARDGRIAWRGEDEIDMDEITDLEAAVADVLAAPVPPVTDHPDVEAPEEEVLSEETSDPLDAADNGDDRTVGDDENLSESDSSDATPDDESSDALPDDDFSDSLPKDKPIDAPQGDVPPRAVP